MNLGVTNWQNNESDYPLINPGNLSGIFCDANFVVYDGFIPVLTSLQIANGILSIGITMDDGLQVFQVNTSNLCDGYSLKLRTTARTYGTLVFGRTTNDLILGTFGMDINIEIQFNPITIRSIDTLNGLYSINGLGNVVDIGLDSNFMLSSQVLSAVSTPINLNVIYTIGSNIYLYSNTKGLTELNLATGNSNSLAYLDKSYSNIYNHNGKLIGVLSNYLYDIGQTPATKLLTLANPVQSLTSDNLGNLWALSNNNLINLGAYPYALTPAITTSLTNLSGIAYINGILYAWLKPNPDFVLGGLFSNQLAILTIAGSHASLTPLSLLMSGSNNHLDSLVSLFSLNGIVYGVGANGFNSVLYQITLSNQTATLLYTVNGDAASGSINTSFIGGPEIISNTIIPLKTINGTDPVNNQFNLAGSPTFSVTQSGEDTLIFGLTIPDSALNVSRTTIYE